MTVSNRMNRARTVDKWNFLKRALIVALVAILVAPASMSWVGALPGMGQTSTASVDEPIYVYFKAAMFDPTTEDPVMPEELSSDGTNGQYVIQLKGPVKDEQKAKLTDAGARMFGYIPDYAFMVELSPADRSNVQALPFVRAVVPLQPAYKLDIPLWTREDAVSVRIDVHRDPDMVVSKVLSLGGVLDHSWVDGVQAIVPGTSLPELAAMGPVSWIEEVPTYHISNDVAAGIMNVNTTWNTYHLNGSGQIVAVADTGLDTGVNDTTLHKDFYGRIVSIIDKYPGDDGANDTNSGHGTHVAGSVLGDGTRSNGKVKGIAYGARLYFQALEDNSAGAIATSTPLDTWLFQPAYDAGARVHTNSWGSNLVDGTYSSASSDVDDMVWTHDDMVILFAVGNSGKDANSDGIVDLNSIDAPATAKNCISVGAMESNRPSKGWGYPSGNFPAEPIKSDNAANNPKGMAAFSSRGPVKDNRIKPDVVAPGTGILSTRSSMISATGWGLPTTEASSTYYMYDGGTSMATPLTAGAAAVVRQFYVANMSYSTPSAALVKATLINGAFDMPGQYSSPKNDTGPVWDYNQGWGRVNLTNSLFPAPRDFYFEDKLHSLSTGNSQSYEVNVSGTLPFKVTLVWSDYPAATNANPALVNNLDLSLTAPNGTVYKGNFFSGGQSKTGGSFDNRNNVENVFFKVPVTGKWTIKVNGTNIPSGPQKYALFFSGVLSAPPPVSPTLNSPASGSYVSARPTFNLTTTDINNDQVQYRIELSKDNFVSVLQAYNQSGDSSGWTKLKYASGENGYYTVKPGDELTDNVKYYWRAYAWDGTGWSSVSATRNFTVDAKGPTGLTISINTGKNSTNTRPVTLAVSATDSFSGMSGGQSGMSFSKDGVSWSAWENYAVSKAWTLEDYQGVQRAYFRARDNVGNIADPVSSTIIYDNVAPTGLTISIDSGAAYSKDDRVNLSLSVSDSTSGLWQMSFSNDGTAWGPWETVASVKTGWNITDTTSGGNANEGTKTVYFRAKDNADNIAQKVSGKIIYDKKAPSNGYISINGGDMYTNSRLVNVLISGTDDISGISEMSLDTNGAFGPWEPYVSTKFVVVPTCDGVKTIKIKLRDGAGNEGPIFTGTIIFDETPPANITIAAKANITNSLQEKVYISAKDPTSGLWKMSFSFDGLLWSPWETYATSKDLTLPANDGTKSIYVRIMDGAGNIGGPQSTTVLFDASPPEATMTVNSGAAYTNSTTVQLAFQLPGVTDLTGYTVSISIDGTSWDPDQPLKTSMSALLLSGDGEKKVHARIKDPAKNTLELESAIIILDQTAPNQVSVAINGGAEYTGQAQVRLTLQGSDEFGIAYMAFSNDGTTWGPLEPFAAKKDLELVHGLGDRTVYVMFQDKAMNKAFAQSTITLDESPPEIFYFRINNVSQDAVSYVTSTNIGYTISAFDEGTNLSDISFGFNGITWNPWTAYKPSGNLVLPTIPGPITVYVRVKDHAGNIGNVSSATVLLDNQPPEAVSIMLNNGEATTTSSQVVLRVSAVDITSGLDEFRYKEGNGAWSSWFPFLTTKSIKLTEDAGDKTVYLEVKDRAGNIAPQSSTTITLQKKVSQPDLTVKVTSHTGGQTVKGTVRLAGTVTGGEPKVVQIRIDGGAWFACDGKATWSYTWDTVGISEGTHILEVQANNGANNYTTGSMALTVKNKSSETSKTVLGEFSMMSLLILIIIVIIVAAVVGAGVAAAMKPKNPPPGMREIDTQSKTMPRPPQSTRGPAKKAREPVACANCGYAIEPDEHLTACKSCNAPFHDDCAQTGDGYCSKCGGSLY